MGDILQELLGYFQSGGVVMPPLAVATVVLWYVLGYRNAMLKRGNRRSARVLVERYRKGYSRKPKGVIDAAVVRGLALSRANQHLPELRSVLDDALGGVASELSRGRSLVHSVVAAAPLAGLLGTVMGMIETFDSLADMELFSQSGGIAGGISQALFTTQMGLAVAVPGIVVGRILDRRQTRFEVEIEQIKDILCAARPGGPVSDSGGE